MREYTRWRILYIPLYRKQNQFQFLDKFLFSSDVKKKDNWQNVGTWNIPIQENRVYEFRTNGKCLIQQSEWRTLHSNVVTSYTVKTRKQLGLADPLPLDIKAYKFVVDTGTTFHICIHKELFFGPTNKAKSMYIKGVGGRVKFKGYGRIKTQSNQWQCGRIQPGYRQRPICTWMTNKPTKTTAVVSKNQ